MKLVLGRDICFFQVRFLTDIIKVPFIKRINRNMKTLFIRIFLNFLEEGSNSDVSCRDLLVEGRSELLEYHYYESQKNE